MKHCFCFIFQVASCHDWVLGIQILQFENLFNYEMRNGSRCCCDDPLCVEGEAELEDCRNRCDMYFATYFPIGEHGSHSLTLVTLRVIDDNVISWPVGLQIYLEQSDSQVEVGDIQQLFF